MYRSLGWKNGVLQEQGIIFYSMEKEKENHQMGTGCFIQHRIETAVKIVECVSDRM